MKATSSVDENRSAMNSSMRPILRVSDILDTMDSKKFTINQNSSVLDAISHVVNEKIASSLVVNYDNEILGIFTARDILKCIKQNSIPSEFRQRRGNFLTETPIKQLMTPKENLVYCSPNDSVRRCREIMFQCKIRSLPVIEGGEVKGIVTAKHLADASFSIKDTGGKKGFISNVTGRRGLPNGTKITEDMLLRKMDRTKKSGVVHLDMEIASFAMPHPFKRTQGVAMSRRLYGADELSSDLDLCEDAHFALKVNDPILSSEGESGKLVSSGECSESTHSHVYLCVADGVGSWRQFGVDPRDYSHRLVDNAKRVIMSDMEHRQLIKHSPFDRDLDPVHPLDVIMDGNFLMSYYVDLDPVHPLDVIMDAWNMTNSECVVGSSTICIATLDKKLGQLSYSNVGDCGLLVIRNINTDVLGYMHQTSGTLGVSTVPDRASGLHIAYLSQQQLRSFNLPYQLGFSDLPNTPNSFESPSDADTASISVLPGDVVILATDGLFDNMDLDDIVKEVAVWERENSEQVKVLAEQLVHKARLLSLEKDRDSPFALLAKENDIMWGGGMPDDTTVVVARVTGSTFH
eukprot:CAMPEP_0170412594 /NCGR_PEP_ID=MMETSP0117_2-20130122/31058_1 /TAXON_ID=400756 /ORGANISM="Durinskia baltica, Strain CSIRO CS-38" /LENGTH=574 /DNA_ID=CAMNT_0010670307 /DNA_START=151 /DNA_END=1875 /DNA_ORIENTATION=-